MKHLINQFNHPETYIVISDYPEKTKESEKNYGIAWHTKEVIDPIASQHDVPFVVLAEKGVNSAPELYQNNKILVLRVFDQKKHSLFPTILTWLLCFNKIKNVHVHSEFCANGGIKNQILLFPFLLLIKLTGKNITYFAHNVVLTVNDIAPHLNLKKNSLAAKMLNFGLKYYYSVLGLFIDKFVVMDATIFARLSQFVPQNHITLIPFGIPKVTKKYSKQEARSILDIKKDEFVLLYFGFITYYKGADWIVKTVKEITKQNKFKKIRLIMAGGPAQSLKDKPYYQRFYNKVLSDAKKASNVQITGFVPEDQIETYFTAADVAVFPYKGLIGASASMAMAIRYGVPFIASDKMHEVFESQDMKEALSEAKITQKKLMFKHTTASFVTILEAVQDEIYRNSLTRFTTSIATKRNSDYITELCYNKLYSQNAKNRHGKSFRFSLT